MLDYQFNLLTYQRDVITMIDNLSLIRDEVQNIEKKFDNKLAMIYENVLNKNKSNTDKNYNLKQVLQEEQKFSDNDFSSQKQKVLHENFASKVKRIKSIWGYMRCHQGIHGAL